MNPRRTTPHDTDIDRHAEDEEQERPESPPAGAEPEAAPPYAARADAAAPVDEAAPLQDEAVAPEALAELEALRDRHLRLAAEYDNYRKRTERERAESWTRAQAQLAERLLDSLDDLQRVADFDPETTSAAALLDGVQLVERKLLRELEAAGLEIIDAKDRDFDPTVHEAMMTSETRAREEDDTVAEVFQPGYRFKELLLRPARVQVRKYRD